MTQLHDRVDVIVEAGLRGASVGNFVWDVSTWDSGASWSGVEPTFVAVDGWKVVSVNSQRGRATGNRRMPSGTATVVLAFRTPVDNWSFRPASPLQLGMEVRISCRARSRSGIPISGVIPIYRGTVRDISDEWRPTRTDVDRQTFRVTAQLTDRFSDLASVDLPERPVEGLGDLTHQRLARIFGLADVSTYYLKAPTPGVVAHQSSNFARNLLDECQVAVEGETGDLYVDRAGFVTFRSRQGAGSVPAREASPRLTWANDGTSAAIGPTAFATGQNLDDVVNQVSRARTGGTAYTASDPDSKLAYGLRTDQRFDLTCRDDVDVAYNADFWLDQLHTRTQRIDKLEANVDPNMPDARLVELIDVELRDMHAIRWTDGQTLYTGTAHVQGISHVISGDAWKVSVNLWAYADEGLVPAVAVAKWDVGKWDVDTWGP